MLDKHEEKVRKNISADFDAKFKSLRDDLEEKIDKNNQELRKELIELMSEEVNRKKEDIKGGLTVLRSSWLSWSGPGYDHHPKT